MRLPTASVSTAKPSGAHTQPLGALSILWLRLPTPPVSTTERLSQSHKWVWALVRSPCWTSFTRGRGLICASPCWVVTTFKQLMAKCIMWLLLRALLLESVSWGGLIGSPCVEKNRCNCNLICYNPIGTLPSDVQNHLKEEYGDPWLRTVRTSWTICIY